MTYWRAHIVQFGRSPGGFIAQRMASRPVRRLMRVAGSLYLGPDRSGVRWLLAPGLALQGLTTREPDDGQIACAIAALERVLRSDGVEMLHRVA